MRRWAATAAHRAVVMTKRLDTGSPWLLHNNPAADTSAPDPVTGNTRNSELLLRDVVQTQHRPRRTTSSQAHHAGPGLTGAFVDGGVSP